MGFLEPACIASDGRRLWAFVITYSPDQYSNYYYTLIKSNQDPADINDITWSFVYASPFYYNVNIRGNAIGEYLCAVDEIGTFTVLSMTKSPLDGSSKIQGLQYQPEPASSDPFAKIGTWKNVETVVPYLWKPSLKSGVLFYSPGGSGSEKTLMHAWADEASDKINVGVLDKKTMLLTQVQPEWPRIPNTHPALVTFRNNSLYALGNTVEGKYTLTSMPVKGGSTTPPGVDTFQTWDATLVSWNCPGSLYTDAIILPLTTNLFMFCKDSLDLESNLINVLVFDGLKFTKIATYNNPDAWSMVPMVGGISTDPFLFMHRGSFLYSVQLNGIGIGTSTKAKNFIHIQENYGDLELPSPSSTDPPTATPPGGKRPGTGYWGEVWLTVGVVPGVVVVLAVAGLLVYRRRRLRRRAAKDSAGSTVEPPVRPLGDSGEDIELQSIPSAAAGVQDGGAGVALATQHQEQNQHAPAEQLFILLPTNHVFVSGGPLPDSIQQPATVSASHLQDMDGVDPSTTSEGVAHHLQNQPQVSLASASDDMGSGVGGPSVIKRDEKDASLPSSIGAAEEPLSSTRQHDPHGKAVAR